MVRSPSGRLVALPMPPDGHHAVVTPRADLDAALVAARTRGGHRGGRGRARRGGRDRARRRGRDPRRPHHAGPLRVVAADGHYSAVRRLVEPGTPTDLGSSHAFRQYFRGVRDRRLWVIFEPDLLPGYAWVFPLPGDRANVGFGVLARRRHPRQGARHHLARAARPARGPGRPRPRRRARGPAPGLADPRGVRADAPHRRPRALRRRRGRRRRPDDRRGRGPGARDRRARGPGGRRRWSDGRGRPRATARRRRRALGRDLRLAAAIGRLLRSDTGTRGALRLVDSSPWTRRHFARWMFEDYPRALAHHAAPLAARCLHPARRLPDQPIGSLRSQ